MNNFATNKLRAERLKRGLSLTKITMLTGIPPSQLSMIERGLVICWPGWQKRLADALGMPITVLFQTIPKNNHDNG